MPLYDNEGKPKGPEWKTTPEGGPDRYTTLVRKQGGQQVGIEWSTLGKKVDLSREAQGLPRKTLVQLEGDERPRYLIGRGRMVDIARSMQEGTVAALDLDEYSMSVGGILTMAVGDRPWEGDKPVARILQEDLDAGHMHDVDGRIEQSPFENVEEALRGLPGSTERANTILSQDPNLNWLIGA